MFFRCMMLGANHRFAVFFFLLAVTVAAGLGVPDLRIDTGFQSLIPADNPDWRIYDKVVREFGSDNRSIVYIRDPRLWTKEKLAALEALHYSLAGLDFVKQVDDLFTLKSVRGNGGRIDSRPILSGVPPDSDAIQKAKRDALYNPLIVNNFISKEGTATAILVTLKEDYIRNTDALDVNRAIQGIVSKSSTDFHRIFQVGPPRINAELKTILLEDLKVLSPLSAAVLVAAILLFLRSGFAALVPITTSALSIVWTFGMMGRAGIPLSILSAMLPTLIVVIGSTEDTHMIATYFQGVSRAKENHRMAATRFMMTHLGIPLLLTVSTTALGFASNIFSNMTIIKNFALASTFAILANGIITILLVPMMLSLLGPTRTGLFKGKEEISGLPGIFFRLFRFIRQNIPRFTLLATFMLCLFFAYQFSKLYVTSDPMSYFRKDQPLVRDTQRIHEDLAGIKIFYIALASDRENAFQEPENLEKLAMIQAFLKEQGIFDGSLSLADHLSLINREFHDGDSDYYRIPGTREKVSQLLLFLHRSDLAGYVSHDFKRACIVVRHNVNDSATLNRYVRELEQVVDNVAGDGCNAHVLGENLMINAAAEDLIIAQVKSLGILLGVIFIITSVMFTSLKGGIISLIPNLIPIILMFGIMGFFKIPLNPGTAMVAVIAIGIAVDGTLHLFSRYNELCRRTSDYEQAVYTTVREEASAMVTTSLALAFGFGILIFSNFTLIAQFGALSALTMLFALFANLFITPLIMSRIRLVGIYQILTLKLHKDVLAKSPLFRGMSNYQMRKTILISELNEFGKGELLIEQGSIGRSMYLILSGTADVIRRTGKEEKCIARLAPGQIFGEIGYIREIERTADVRAASDVEVLRFDYRKLETDLKFFPYLVSKLNFNISRILGERLANAYTDPDLFAGRQEGRE